MDERELTPRLTDEGPVEQSDAAGPCGPALSDRRRGYVAKRLISLIDECAGYGGDPAERARTAADATRALIELDGRTEQEEPAGADLTNHLPSRGA